MEEKVWRCDICRDTIHHERPEYRIQNKKGVFDLCKRCYMLMIGGIRETAQKENPVILFELDDTIPII